MELEKSHGTRDKNGHLIDVESGALVFDPDCTFCVKEAKKEHPL